MGTNKSVYGIKREESFIIGWPSLVEINNNDTITVNYFQ